MTSISVSDYQNGCSKLIREAVRRPRMYYRSLDELEAVLSGHQIAFEQLGVISRDQSFQTCFVDWLYRTMNASGSAGWACAIESLASARGDDAESVFAELVEQFLSQWRNVENASEATTSRGKRGVTALALLLPASDKVRTPSDWFHSVANGPLGTQVIWDDFDGDNDIDVATVHYGWDDMAPEDQIWLQDGEWRFQISQVIGGYEQWSSEAVHADFDQDGDVDLFIGQDGGASKLWLNDGKGKFSACSFNFGGGAHAVAVGDIDGDGDVDIFTVGCAPPTVWLNETIGPKTGVKR